MSQNNEVSILEGHLNSFNLNNYSSGRYFFELSNIPLVNSISLGFDLENNVIYKDCNVVCINNKTTTVISNQIKYIGFSLPECDKYCDLLIGMIIIENGRKVKITKSNCRSYKFLLNGKIIIDFSGSEQIKEILDKTDEFNQRICQTFTVSYFTEN